MKTATSNGRTPSQPAPGWFRVGHIIVHQGKAGGHSESNRLDHPMMVWPFVVERVGGHMYAKLSWEAAIDSTRVPTSARDCTPECQRKMPRGSFARAAQACVLERNVGQRLGDEQVSQSLLSRHGHLRSRRGFGIREFRNDRREGRVLWGRCIQSGSRKNIPPSGAACEGQCDGRNVSTVR